MTLSPKKFLPVFMITWFYIGLGSALSLIFIMLAGNFQQNSFFYFFTQNFGIFIFFTSLLAGYSGVYRAVNSGSATINIRASIKNSLKRSHYILAVSFMTVILFSSIVLIETGFSMISEIPYAGPAIMALLTAPIFILNIFIVVAAVCVFAVAPPIIGEAEGMKDVVSEIRILVGREWLNIVFYLLISLSLLTLGIILIVIIIRYAGGITKAVQWKIIAAYPSSMKHLIAGSYFSDVIYKIVPSADSMSAIRQYGSDILNYFKIIKYIITLSLLLIISFAVSFPLAIYFSLSSVYFKKIWKSS